MTSSRPITLSARIQRATDAPMVSVICATYNQHRYVRACLDGVLAQVTDFDVEIIVHDDASTDGTADIIRAYAERHPDKLRAILRSERLFSPTKRIRLDLYPFVRGRYVALCDGDDFWRDPHKLAEQVQFLESHPQYVLAYHDANIVNGDGKTLVLHARQPASNRHFSSTMLRRFACGWIPLPAMMHRHVDLGYPPEFDLAPNSDNFLVMLLGQYGDAGYQHHLRPSAVRFHGANYFSVRSAAEKSQMHLQTHLQMVNYLLRTGETDHARAMLTHRLAASANAFLKAGAP